MKALTMAVKIDEEQLINLVQSNPEIYDCSLKEYHNVSLKEGKWISIGQQMGISPAEIQKKWKDLRDKFNREMKKGKSSLVSGAGTSEVYKSQWHLLKPLLFLLPHLKCRSTSGNVMPFVPNEEITIFDLDSSSITQMTQTQPEIQPQPEDVVPPRRKRKQNHIDDNIQNALMEIVAQKDDEMTLFAKSIVPSLNRLNRRRQHQAKIQILHLLEALELEQENETITC